MEFIEDDGGRSKAGYKGFAGDCVVRAITIATQKDYQEVYDALKCLANDERLTRKHKEKSSVRDGVVKNTYTNYLKNLGWTWKPAMFVGSGCKMHLKKEELPSGRIIVRLSGHLAAVIDGVLHDTYDCSRDETRCVYGYFIKE